MGKYVLLILLSMGFYAVEAQVTTISINKENFQSSGFPFKGTRVLQVERILTPKEVNYIVFS